jgi:hypothetical protein
MSEWVYKSKPTKANYDDTHDLAVFNHFLVRSAYEYDGDGVRRVPLVPEVAVGDTIHYFYRKIDAKIGCFGSFIVEPASAYPGVFAPCEGHDPLVTIVEGPDNQRILDKLKRGYEPDPELGIYTGWAIKRLPSSHATPKFDQTKMFPGAMTLLWRYPDPGLPAAKKVPASKRPRT